MKKSLALGLLFAICASGALAQSNYSPTVDADSKSTPEKLTLAQQSPLLTLELKPNEIRFGSYSLDGIGIELFNVPNPLQLLSPCAPAGYGDIDDNVIRDIASGRVAGLKLLSFNF